MAFAFITFPEIRKRIVKDMDNIPYHSRQQALNNPDCPLELSFEISAGLLVRKEIRNLLQTLEWEKPCDVSVTFKEISNWLSSSFLIKLDGKAKNVVIVYDTLSQTIPEN